MTVGSGFRKIVGWCILVILLRRSHYWVVIICFDQLQTITM